MSIRWIWEVLTPKTGLWSQLCSDTVRALECRIKKAEVNIVITHTLTREFSRWIGLPVILRIQKRLRPCLQNHKLRTAQQDSCLQIMQLTLINCKKSMQVLPRSLEDILPAADLSKTKVQALRDLIIHVPISTNLKPRDRLTVMFRNFPTITTHSVNYLHWRARESSWVSTVWLYRNVLKAWWVLSQREQRLPCKIQGWRLLFLRPANVLTTKAL